MQGRFLEDGASEWEIVVDLNDTTHVSLNGDFGGGLVHIEKQILGETFPVYENGIPIVYEAPEDVNLGIQTGDVIRIRLAGSSNPDLYWSIS